ncbi:MAG: glycosyltransferase family 2 protein [Clostridia bacterium]|nr:glycosyltransferase family 2 protein [Clostridia bacterium]
MKKISVVVPCYNEQESVELFYNEMVSVAAKMNNDFEFIFVNDGSKDRTLEIVKGLGEKDERVKYISFSRNFGKEAAIYAGFSNASGDYVVMMDADLQDPPKLLPEMLDAIEKEGYDSVATRRVTRKGEPPIRSFFARMFYKLINKISDVDIVDGARDYRLMTAKMKDAIVNMPEYNRFSKGIFGWVGFNTKWLEYENIERVAGETKWNFWKLFLYSIEGIIAYSTAPLALAYIFGFLSCLGALGLFIFSLVRTFAFGDPFGSAATLASACFFVGGVQLICMGILGHYLSKTYLETKKRPVYIVKDTNI